MLLDRDHDIKLKSGQGLGGNPLKTYNPNLGTVHAGISHKPCSNNVFRNRNAD